MRQADRGTYEKDSYSKELGRSCLFKIFKLGGVIILLLIIAILTVPSEKRMKKGAFDEAAAETKFEAWKKEKEVKAQKVADKEAADKAAEKKARLDAEKKANEALAAKIAEKKAAALAAQAAEEAPAEAPAEGTEATEAPAEA